MADINEIRAGEIVTLVAKTENTYGRDPKVTWASNGGNLKTEDNGRVARVQFDRPGVYKVDATLEVEGKFVRRDTTMIEVRPLP